MKKDIYSMHLHSNWENFACRWWICFDSFWYVCCMWLTFFLRRQIKFLF